MRDGFGVKGRVGVWVVVLLYPTINSCNPFNYDLSIYGRNKGNYPIQLSYFVVGSLKTIQVKEKKKAGMGGLYPTVMGTKSQMQQ